MKLNLTDKQTIEQAKILRFCSKMAGMSSDEDWNDLSIDRRARWIALAQGIANGGYAIISREDLAVLRDRAMTSSYEQDTESISALETVNEVLSSKEEEEDSVDLSHPPDPDSRVVYVRIKEAISVHITNWNDVEVQEVILGLWMKLSLPAKMEVRDRMNTYFELGYIGSPIINAFKESTGDGRPINLNKFMPRGGIRRKK